MALGFRVCQRERQIDAQTVAQFSALPVPVVSDVMGRMFAGGVTLRPIHKSGAVLAGPALTVRTRPGDNLMIHKALDMAQAGDVIVVDAGGDLTNALMGELMVAYAERKGVAGIVLNGAIRDYAALSAGALPIFAAGVTHRGPYKDGPGEINVPISLGGMTINPGDLVLGDEDGLVSVAIDDAEAVFIKAEAKHRAETEQMEKIRTGTNDRTWVDATLRKLDCEGV